MELSAAPAGLIGVADYFSESAALIAGDLDTLHGAISRMESAWSGEAKKAFHAKYTGFQQEATAMVEKLRRAAAGLHDLAQEYADADRKSAAAQPTPQ